MNENTVADAPEDAENEEVTEPSKRREVAATATAVVTNLLLTAVASFFIDKAGTWVKARIEKSKS